MKLAKRFYLFAGSVVLVPFLLIMGLGITFLFLCVPLFALFRPELFERGENEQS